MTTQPMQNDAQLQRARAAAEAGRYEEADAAFARVLESDPGHVETLNYLAQRALLAGRAKHAVAMLEQATAAAADNAELWKNLGFAHIATGQSDAAAAALETSVRLDPDAFRARLFLAQIHEGAGRVREATMHYFGAIIKAQAQGLWLDEATTPPAMRERVLRAMDFVDRHRHAILTEVLEPLRARHGDVELARAQRCLDIYLGAAQAGYPDPRQRPKFLYFPGLPTTPYFDRALFPWYAQLEDNVEAIRAELRAVLRDERGIAPFLGTNSLDRVGNQLAGAQAPPAWDAFFFHRHGERIDDNCARCPRTAAILDSLPLVRIREHAPEICFSVLTPGTHILPHRGVTNTRLVTHLPLIVPENCAIVVGGEKREWREGECFTFDDTFEHEAWNRGASTRVVMLMDCWNPWLTEVERDAVTLLVGEIGDFNRAAGVNS
ncbi:MAG: aspartyl/asparaginyl beta-hydroxylase domain-containing protein [Proteobacteria bacterium]|uniref:aspartyl/asparaginyl beta-hydroxylase domain-containing protein n=1 Tax=Rudaea sp. TaxID=2136325 RepID=UPI00321FF202|nr:aspartyl/asparaginyl beta-hydroxylase domain-containing protein [Pseudomonadota bacterium]